MGTAVAILALIAAVLAAAQVGTFPESWNIGLRGPLDEFKRWIVGNRQTHPMFLYFFEPLSDAIDWGLRRVEGFLLWLPWPVIIAAIFSTASFWAFWSRCEYVFAVVAKSRWPSRF